MLLLRLRLRLRRHSRHRVSFGAAGPVRRFRSRSAESHVGSSGSVCELLNRLELRSFWANRGPVQRRSSKTVCTRTAAEVDLAPRGLWTTMRYAASPLSGRLQGARRLLRGRHRQRHLQRLRHHLSPPLRPRPHLLRPLLQQWTRSQSWKHALRAVVRRLARPWRRHCRRPGPESLPASTCATGCWRSTGSVRTTPPLRLVHAAQQLSGRHPSRAPFGLAAGSALASDA